MTKRPKPKPKPDEDEAESRRFIEAAERLAADGDLNLTEADDAVDALIRGSARHPKPPQP